MFCVRKRNVFLRHVSFTLFMYTYVDSIALNQTFSRISFTNIVTIATQSSVFIKSRVNRLLGNQNVGYAYLVHLI